MGDHVQAPSRPVRSATSAPAACSGHAEDKHHNDSSNRSASDQTHDAAAEMNVEARQKPIAHESAYNADPPFTDYPQASATN
jgi:hypothetical protein